MVGKCSSCWGNFFGAKQVRHCVSPASSFTCSLLSLFRLQRKYTRRWPAWSSHWTDRGTWPWNSTAACTACPRAWTTARRAGWRQSKTRLDTRVWYRRAGGCGSPPIPFWSWITLTKSWKYVFIEKYHLFCFHDNSRWNLEISLKVAAPYYGLIILIWSFLVKPVTCCFENPCNYFQNTIIHSFIHSFVNLLIYSFIYLKILSCRRHRHLVAKRPNIQTGLCMLMRVPSASHHFLSACR